MKACSPLSQPCMFSHLTHHPMLCVCVVPATINTALLLFGKPLGQTKPSQHPSMRTCTLLSIFVHSFSSLSLSFSICLSYFLISQSFSLTFSFLNLFLLLSPFSIFLSYFLLFLSFSVYLPKTLSLTIKYLIQPFNLLSYFLNISLSAFSKGRDEAWGFLNVWEFPTCPRVGKTFFYHKLYIVVIS